MPDDMVAERAFEADLDISDGRVLVAFRGEFDLAAKDAAAAALAAALLADQESIVVDLRGVPFMDCTGINCLIQARSLAHTLGKRIWLLNGSGQPQRLLELTYLDDRAKRRARDLDGRELTGPIAYGPPGRVISVR